MNTPKTKLIFAGTPEIARQILAALQESNQYDIQCILTQPDKPAGRGQKITASPVKQYALNKNIPVLQPANLKSAEIKNTLNTYNSDLMIVVAYGLIIPKNLLSLPKYGCINIHTSLLPKWRGAAPIIHAILANDKKTGVSIMQMEPSLDTGPILSSQAYSMPKNITSAQLTVKLTEIAIPLLLETIPRYLSGEIQPAPQETSPMIYAHKIKKTDARINWHESLHHIEAKIRAFNPWPIAYTFLNNERIRIWEAEPLYGMEASLTPGTIIDSNNESLDICVNGGILRILKLQRPGGKIISAASAMNQTQNPIEIGMQLES